MLSKMMNSSKMSSLKTRIISRSGANPAGTTARKFSQILGGKEGSTVSYSFQLINLGNIFDG